MRPLTCRDLNPSKRKKESYLAVIEKKAKNSLWRQVISKKRKLKFHQFANKNLFFNFAETLVDAQSPKNEFRDPLKDRLDDFILECNEENKVEKLYQKYIQNNGANEHTYRCFYNKLSAKIEILKIISVDKGKNIALVPNLMAKFLCLLTYSVEIASSHVLRILGAGARHGINKISELRKIRSAENKLEHCITEHKFIKLLSILLTTMHALDIPTAQEEIASFVDKHFLSFWSLFKKQVKLSPNTENLNSFWSTCLFMYFKELKSPLLQENFDRCLNNMIGTLKDVNHLLQLKNIMEINQKNNYIAFFQLFMLQIAMKAAVEYYIIQAANSTQSSDAPTNFATRNNGFWQNNNAPLCSATQAARYAESLPRLIACH